MLVSDNEVRRNKLVPPPAAGGAAHLHLYVSPYPEDCYSFCDNHSTAPRDGIRKR